MINLSDIITAIQTTLANNSYLNGLLGGRVTLSQMPQQTGSSQTIFPYLTLNVISGETCGQFGDNFLDKPVVQFTVFTTTTTQGSDIIQSIGNLFNHCELTTTDSCTQFLQCRRNGTVMQKFAKQDKYGNYIYQTNLDFEFQFGTHN